MDREILVKGMIGLTDNMKPTLEKREGNKYSTLHFRMFVKNKYNEVEKGSDGKDYAKDDVYECRIVGKMADSLFPHLAAGRNILVRGNLDHRPRSVLNRTEAKKILETHTDATKIITAMEGAITTYANPVIHVNYVQFLDEQPIVSADRVLKTLLADCKVITDDQRQEFLTAFKEQDKTRRTNLIERIDNSNDDPDDLGLN